MSLTFLIRSNEKIASEKIPVTMRRTLETKEGINGRPNQNKSVCSVRTHF